LDFKCYGVIEIKIKYGGNLLLFINDVHFEIEKKEKKTIFFLNIRFGISGIIYGSRGISVYFSGRSTVTLKYLYTIKTGSFFR